MDTDGPFTGRSKVTNMFASEGDAHRLNWRKAARSMSNGACVEVANAADAVAIRDTLDRAGTIVTCSDESWRNFTGAIRRGHYDINS